VSYQRGKEMFTISMERNLNSEQVEARSKIVYLYIIYVTCIQYSYYSCKCFYMYA
jgi:hypothetical protein